MMDAPATYTVLEQRLMNEFQRNLPVTSKPYEYIALQLGVSEEQVLQSLGSLQSRGAVSRVGPVFRPNAIGVSTLVAVAVPDERVDAVADIISSYPEVNHNYERDHEFNLWFVVTAPDPDGLQTALGKMEQDIGYPLMSLPMTSDYFIDLGFELQWQR